MILCVPNTEAQKAVDHLNNNGEQAWLIGSIEQAQTDEDQVILQGL